MFGLNISVNNFNIESPDDWYKIQRTTIRMWKKNHGMFIKDIERLEKTVDQYIANASNFLVMHRQTKKSSFFDKAQQEYRMATEALKSFSKRELLATLSQR